MKRLTLFFYLLAPFVNAATPSQPAVTLENFKIVGDLSEGQARFTLTAMARVQDRKGGSLELLSGAVALTEVGPHPKWRVRAEQTGFILTFDRAGTYPIALKFTAAVRQSQGWNAVDFHVAPGALQKIAFDGLRDDTQFDFPGAARPERADSQFTSFLPPDGSVKLSWKEARPESEGKLFYSAEMLSQISISPGLMRQLALLDFKVMQGELTRMALLLRGSGEVTRVQGEQVLAWNLEPVPNSSYRRLVVQFNQPQKDQFNLQVQLQTPLGAFPQSADAILFRPEGATRFAGYYRIVNEGAVRLEVAQASGLSQISPEQFPESEMTRAVLRLTGSQRFVYRFSGGDIGLRIQADQILPELSVSELLAYRLGENEQAIDAELELDIREAPLRELVLRIPKGYAVARLAIPGLSDYFTREPEGQPDAELRLVFGQPASGRQVLQLRLERNKALSEATWALPRVEVVKAKSVRGHVAVAADPGFRLTPERTQALTEIATAFFPRKMAGIQSAFRLNDPAWQASVRVERLPQTVQADGLHLFSIGEGIAYGSSLINYVISGAPVSAFRIELSDEYYNVEFSGKEVRNWQKVPNGYLVQLHTPVSGAYSLLATYERPFKPQGETLGFAGARPLDAQSEQGHTLVISAYQFQVTPADVSPGLLALETAEVPAEYRLFFDAPILAAYRYAARPFNLRLALSPLVQGDSLSQVVDRASVTTRVSKEGQVLTELRYFLKNRGNPYLKLQLPANAQLWSATVNGAAVVPVTDAGANLIPLPQNTDPNAALTLDLKLAARSSNPTRVRVATPTLYAPVMLAEWKIEPDTGQRLVYRSGSLAPLGGAPDASGFAQIGRIFTTGETVQAWTLLLGVLFFLIFAVVLWRWAVDHSSHRLSPRHIGGALGGLIGLVIALVLFSNLADLAKAQEQTVPGNVLLLAPVQQVGSALSVEVSNLADKWSLARITALAWPTLLGLALWAYAGLSAPGPRRNVAGTMGWLMMAWTVLRFPNSFVAFAAVVACFLLWHVMIPALRRLWLVPARSSERTEPGSALHSGAAPAATTLLVAGLFVASATASRAAADASAKKTEPNPSSTAAGVRMTAEAAAPESVLQDIRVEGKFVFATAKLHWSAEKGQRLTLVAETAVLTAVHYPSNSLDLIQGTTGAGPAQYLLARKRGTFDAEVEYQLEVRKRDAEAGFCLPTQFGLVNRLNLAMVNLDVDVSSPAAVSVRRDLAGSNTVAELVLSPAKEAWIGWKPRSRDVKREKPVFYAELTQLYVPAAGVIEGVHLVSVRPAQGELAELILDVPEGATITDVLDAAAMSAVANTNSPVRPSVVSLWRFDPDTRKLRVRLSPSQSRPFALLVRSQSPAGPLPFERPVGLLGIDNSAGQIGLLALATGSEVQLDNVRGDGFSPVNLEDFPSSIAGPLQGQVPGLTVPRAFRYAEPGSKLSLQVSAVEPDVRVDGQSTLSLGEDRGVLAANITVDITRAGIFRLSFVLPAGFDVESISGNALSHWTEQRSDGSRAITLHLNGKTEGQQQFAISLAGPGVKAAKGWAVPQLVLREASKQQGTLLVVPEQGLRLQVAASEGLTQLDPQKSGIKQKGVLAFRILQTPRSLALDIEQVDPWVQVTSLQQATVTEAQVKVTANLQYQIENTGLKALRVFLPTNAESVRFQGEQVADFLPVTGLATNGLQGWEIKLHRRVIGPYLLQAGYQLALPERAAEFSLRGLQVADVNLQRGFVTVQSSGRLQVRSDNLPAALQPAEWQSIPRSLQQGFPVQGANFAYRLVEPAFDLPLKLERHEAAKLLPARVNNITFDSAISDAGVMLTHIRLEIVPGDKRLLSLTLPADARFWFAFVNQAGVWPWRQQDRLLIPLEQQSRVDQAIPVEIFYSSQIGDRHARSLDLTLLAPKFDLPLENVTWRVSLPEQWRVTKWSGSLQLQEQQLLPQIAAADLQNYLQVEATQQRERTKQAEDLVAAANSALQQGEPQQARRAFQAAYGLSTHDAAFNEDTRVQLHNIKLQQALIGLNVRQSASAGESGPLAGKLRDLRGRKELSYSQQDAKDILDRNTADDNAAFMRVAERLIQQQDAAVSSPGALRVNIPDQGRVLTFKRSVVVDDKAELRIALRASATAAASWNVRAVILIGTFGVLVLFLFLSRSYTQPSRA